MYFFPVVLHFILKDEEDVCSICQQREMLFHPISTPDSLEPKDFERLFQYQTLSLNLCYNKNFKIPL